MNTKAKHRRPENYVCAETVWHLRHATSNYSHHLHCKHKTEFDA